MPSTHSVTNTVPPLVEFDVSAADPAVHAGLAAAGSGMTEGLRAVAINAGSAQMAEAARLADTNPPQLRTYDRSGNRIDEVDYHPAWHTLMSSAVGAGLQGAPWAPDATDRAHLHRAVGFYLQTQIESGHLCPISMTYSAIPALRHEPELVLTFESGLRSRIYDFGLGPPATKRGLLAGMSMTEKQGGSDLRALTTTAIPSEPGGDQFRITGHKWFTSAPMNDVFLTLARAPSGITCFLIPRVLPDGERNAMTLLRLKDKLGNRSNASAEVEYDGAVGWRVGHEGRGVATILEMVTMTRLDCVLGSAGQIRAALSHAAFYARHRFAFGRALADKPAMTAVLADLAVESWASTLTALRLAALADELNAGSSDDVTRGDGASAALLRICLPVTKFWVCKRAVPVIAEALECMGGNGFVETFPMARLLRESPLNGIWEGSGTVTALDALRALQRTPESGQALLDELGTARGADRWYDQAVTALADLMHRGPDDADARALCSLAARTLAASLLIRQAPAKVADVYCATRLGALGERAFGELPSGLDGAGRSLRETVTAITPELG